jgi:hypothetical protein
MPSTRTLERRRAGKKKKKKKKSEAGWFIWQLEYEATAKMTWNLDVLNVAYCCVAHLERHIDDLQYKEAVLSRIDGLSTRIRVTTKKRLISAVSRRVPLAFIICKRYF